MCASHTVLNRLMGEMKVRGTIFVCLLSDRRQSGRSTDPLILLIDKIAELERIRWYPKDGELCLGKTKPEETLVEVCSDSDVQIDRQTWV
jgi:hypothetical protein